MKNNGFTLVEVLAVIVILGILITVAVPNVINTSKNTRENMYQSKVDMIEKAAQLYAQDNYDIINEINTKTKKITITELLNSNYLKKDSNDCVVGSGCIKDPRDNNSMDNKNVCLCIVNKRARAAYLGDDTDCTISVCKSGNNYEEQ